MEPKTPSLRARVWSLIGVGAPPMPVYSTCGRRRGRVIPAAQSLSLDAGGAAPWRAHTGPKTAEGEHG
jgi:hypothetical protein